MHTYFRVDEWHKSGTSSKIAFCQTEEIALAHVKGMTRVTLVETEGVEHTTTTTFKAYSCNATAWDGAVDSERIGEPAYFL